MSPPLHSVLERMTPETARTTKLGDVLDPRTSDEARAFVHSRMDELYDDFPCVRPSVRARLGLRLRRVARAVPQPPQAVNDAFEVVYTALCILALPITVLAHGN